MIRQIAVPMVIALVLTLLPTALLAQASKEASVTVSGMENVRVQPTLLRLEMRIQASGETAEKAVEQLKERKKAAIAKLKELKAEEGSVRFANTVIGTRIEYAPIEGVRFPTPFGPPQILAPSEAPVAPTTIPAVPSRPYFPLPETTPGSSPPTTTPAIPSPPLAPSQLNPAPAPATPSTSSTSDSGSPPPQVLETSLPVVAPTTGRTTYTPPTYYPASPPSTNAPTAPASPSTTIPGPTLEPIPEASETKSEAYATLHAEWRITTNDPDAIALTGESIRAKLADSHILGADNPSSPVVTTVLPSYGYNYPTPATGIIRGPCGSWFKLSFVGHISDAQRKAATAAAMRKARQRAAELAEVAGMRLGEEGSISSEVNSDFIVSPCVPQFLRQLLLRSSIDPKLCLFRPICRKLPYASI